MTIQQKHKTFLSHFLREQPAPATELVYHNPFQLLIAVVLSAQCTDKRINKVTPALFRRFPDAMALSVASSEEVFSYINSVSYPKTKTAYLLAIGEALITQFSGQVPNNREQLLQLKGVGRKSAHVILSVLYGEPTMPVDTHVFRVSKRIGLVSENAKTPLSAEKELVAYVPREHVEKMHHWLVLHGRYICKARNPLCTSCPLIDFCTYYSINQTRKQQ